MNGYYHTDDATMLSWLENVLRTAREGGRSVRLHTEDGMLKVKVGEGMWTAPFASSHDSYRDGEVNPVGFPRLSVGPNGEPVVSDGKTYHMEVIGE